MRRRFAFLFAIGLGLSASHNAGFGQSFDLSATTRSQPAASVPVQGVSILISGRASVGDLRDDFEQCCTEYCIVEDC